MSSASAFRLTINLDNDVRGVVSLRDGVGELFAAQGFDWPLPAAMQEAIADWKRCIPIDSLKLGKELYGHLFGERIQQALREHVFDSTAQSVLIGVPDTDPEIDSKVHQIPLELLHNGATWLQGGNRILYREIRSRCRRHEEKKDVRVLVVLGEPTNDSRYPPWDDNDFRGRLNALLNDTDLETTVFDGDTRDLAQLLNENSRAESYFTFVIFVAHGEPATDREEGRLVLADAEGGALHVTASTLASMLANHPGAKVALISCNSAMDSKENPFASVARTLSLDGQVSAVCAMQRPVTVDAGLEICASLLTAFAHEDDEFVAFKRADWTVLGAEEHGTPCLFAQTPKGLDGLETDDAIIRQLLSIDTPTDQSLIFSVPTFRMGFSPDDYARVSEKLAKVVNGEYCYRSHSTPLTDIRAIKDLIGAAASIWPLNKQSARVRIESADELLNTLGDPLKTNVIVVGTKSHIEASHMIRRYSDDFEFRYDSEEWSIHDKRTGQVYSTPSPNNQSSRDPDQDFDFALIEKTYLGNGNRFVIFLAGLWDSSTQAAGEFLVRERDSLVDQFGDGSFQVLLRVRSGTTDVVGQPIFKRRPRSAS
ncbi:MAG: hypothetical protein JJ938_02995 [Roseicyclus sp.]|nr:hypothetical protein [Roseicyclus sp.]MBO6922221.1 hypothetical protein [Roseicyclus sp.]